MGSQSHREYKQSKKTKISEPMNSNKQSKTQKKTKKTKISEPMGNENHREYKQQLNKENQDQWSWTRIIDPEILVFYFLYSRLFSSPIGSEILVFLICLVFSIAFATNWFWNLGFLVFCILDGFGYPIYYFSRPLFALPMRMSNGMLPACPRDV